MSVKSYQHLNFDILEKDHMGDITNINILTSVGVEPMNVVCAPSTATSDALNPLLNDNAF